MTLQANNNIGLLQRSTQAQEQFAAMMEWLAGHTGKRSSVAELPFPALQVGDTVRIQKPSGETDVVIDAAGPMPFRRIDNGQLSSASSLNVDLTQLDMQTGELAQYRFSPMDAFDIEFSHPSSTTRQWNTNTVNFRLPPYAADPTVPPELFRHYWQASEFWVFEDETPRFDFYRIAGQTVEMHLNFWSWKYHFHKIADPGAIVLRTSGWPH